MSSILLDTNIIVRLLIGDNPQQVAHSQQLLKKIEVGKVEAYISILVINEVIWIAENFYNLKREKYSEQLLKLLSLKNIKSFEVSKSELVQLLTDFSQQSADFTDYYLAWAATKQKKSVASFDVDFKKLKVRLYAF